MLYLKPKAGGEQIPVVPGPEFAGHIAYIAKHLCSELPEGLHNHPQVSESTQRFAIAAGILGLLSAGHVDCGDYSLIFVPSTPGA